MLFCTMPLQVRAGREFRCGGTALALMAAVESGDKDTFQREVGEARTSDDEQKVRRFSNCSV